MPRRQIDVVPHGAPLELARARAELDAGRRPARTSAAGGYARMESRFLLSTFGLLSPGKGIESMLEALPAIVERHPEVLYVVAGRTHPQIARREGEEYRLMLERLDPRPRARATTSSSTTASSRSTSWPTCSPRPTSS